MDDTSAGFHIGVCRQCGRYGQLSEDQRICALPPPPMFAGEDFFRRTRACQRIAARRAERANGRS